MNHLEIKAALVAAREAGCTAAVDAILQLRAGLEAIRVRGELASEALTPYQRGLADGFRIAAQTARESLGLPPARDEERAVA